MKIGILTFHCAHNYGAVLQTLATQEYLKQLGHSVEIIDYRPQYLLYPYKIFRIDRFKKNNIKELIAEILILPKRILRFVKFQRFINKYLCLSKKCSEYDIPEYFNLYIIGSDQVWNPVITDGVDAIYTANFNFAKNNKIYISYAASLGKELMDKKNFKEFHNSLNNFDGISVRELDAKLFLEKTFSVNNIEVVIDPTLLINKTVWDRYCSKSNINDDYVLLYQIRQSENANKLANKIANTINCKIIEIKSLPISWRGVYQTFDPGEFLSLFKNAKYVITTSFHGTAFSLIFEKQFYTISLGDEGDSRALSLLSQLDIKERLINNEQNINHNNLIDYIKVQNNLQKLQETSSKYYQKYLQ